MAEAIRRLLFIVGSQRRDFYASLRRTFRGDDTVQVVLDRRRGERRLGRRAAGRKLGREHREAERRAHLEIERQLSERGYAVVGVLGLHQASAGPRAKRARDTAR